MAPSKETKANSTEKKEKPTESRSEKKRSREQQRRNQVNEGLDKLTELVFLVDPALKAAARARVAQSNKASTPDSQLLSRVELVNTACTTLARVHMENQANLALLSRLQSGNLMTGMPYPSNVTGMPFIANQRLSSEAAPASSPAHESSNKEESSEGKTTEGNNDKTKEDGPVTKRLRKRRDS
jgi:hypothetical protein